MKEWLFSTPLKDSTVNYSGDTKRELDHRYVSKGIHAGSTNESAMRRMKLHDRLMCLNREKEETKDRNK